VLSAQRPLQQAPESVPYDNRGEFLARTSLIGAAKPDVSPSPAAKSAEPRFPDQIALKVA